MYEYRARILTVLDGDTVRAEVDLGCDVKIRLTIRLLGIDAPELPTVEGKAAREHLSTLIPSDSVVTLQTAKDRREKYGRYLGTLRDPAEPSPSLNERMVVDGHAVPYP